MSITVLILGILAVCLGLVPMVGIIGFLPGLAGLILGIIDWQKSSTKFKKTTKKTLKIKEITVEEKNSLRDEQFLKTGITLSIVAILFALAWIAFILIIRAKI